MSSGTELSEGLEMQGNLEQEISGSNEHAYSPVNYMFTL